MRAAFPTPRLSASSFERAVASRLYLLVRLDVGRSALHAGVGRFFDRQYPGLFGFGTLALREAQGPGWWARNFQSAAGTVRAMETGYWLFHEALVVGHHSGIIRTDLTFTDRTRRAEDHSRGQAELEWVRQVAFDGARVAPVELAAAVELIAYFDGVVSERQARAGFGEAERREAEAQRVTPRSDPYATLKIADDATDDEVRAAYKRAMKLNHPDKLGHMSEEIQAFAHAQVKAIKVAYEAIVAVRGR